MSAGFENGWVELLDLNTLIAADGTADRLDKTIENLKKGRIKVFRGDYTGVNPRNAADVIDLRNGYTENQYSSNPTFGYVLKDYIFVED
jgi:basic membrane protein A